jgi:hypothetical protein
VLSKTEPRIMLENTSVFSFNIRCNMPNQCNSQIQPMSSSVIILMILCASAVEVSDYSHMESCVTCVRSTVSSGHSSIDWLVNQADGRMESVILYLIRACYLLMDRRDAMYGADELLKHASTPVSIFGEYEFKLIDEITKKEAFARIDEKLSIHDDQAGANFVYAFIITALAVTVVMLWKGTTYRTVK